MEDNDRRKYRAVEDENSLLRVPVSAPSSPPAPEPPQKLDIRFLTLEQRAFLVAALHYHVCYKEWPPRPRWLTVKFHDVDFQYLHDWEIALVTDEPTGVVLAKLNAYLTGTLTRPHWAKPGLISNEQLAYHTTVHSIMMFSHA